MRKAGRAPWFLKLVSSDNTPPRHFGVGFFGLARRKTQRRTESQAIHWKFQGYASALGTYVRGGAANTLVDSLSLMSQTIPSGHPERTSLCRT